MTYEPVVLIRPSLSINPLPSPLPRVISIVLQVYRKFHHSIVHCYISVEEKYQSIVYYAAFATHSCFHSACCGLSR